MKVTIRQTVIALMTMAALLRFSETPVFAFNQEDVDRLWRQRSCPGCDLSGALLAGLDLSKVNLQGADLRGADLGGTLLRMADMAGSNLVGADLRGAILEGADLFQADLTGALMEGSNLDGAYLAEAKMPALPAPQEPTSTEAGPQDPENRPPELREPGEGQLATSTETGKEAELPEARVSPEAVAAPISQEVVPLTAEKDAAVAGLLSTARCLECDLSGVDLRGSRLRNAWLERADLSGADLSAADLRGANLKGAILRNAALRGANLAGADMYAADLSGADFSGAKLQGAAIDGAYVTGALFDETALQDMQQ